jgi:hypothetical protein
MCDLRFDVIVLGLFELLPVLEEAHGAVLEIVLADNTLPHRLGAFFASLAHALAVVADPNQRLAHHEQL